MRSELNEEAPAFQCVASKESCWSHRRLLMMRRRFLCQFAVCMLLIEACEALSVISCLVPKDDASGSDRLCGPDDPELHNGDLRIQCTATEVTATFTYSLPGSDKSDFDTSVTSYGVAWICESTFGQEVYECSGRHLLSGPNVEFSLNITERGGWGSNCSMQGCVTYNSDWHRISSGNTCEIGSAITTTVNNTTTVTGSDKTAAHETDDGRNTDTRIVSVLAPLIGVLILLILLVIVVIIALISIIYLRMRKFSHNWQAYGNPELPFDPHYTPVDIEKPSFSPIPRLSLLSVDMLQNLHIAQTNHLMTRNLYTEPPLIHPNIRHDQSESCSSLGYHGNGEESERVSSALSELSIPHTGTSLDDVNALCKTYAVSESSYQPPSVQYNIQHVPLLRNSQSLKDDFQDDIQGNLSSDLDYAESARGISGGDVSHDNLHSGEQSSVPLPTHSDHFPADLVETNTIQLDEAYISSESGYIQSHDTNCSSLFIEDVNPNLDTSNQGEITTQPAKIPSVEQQSLESPTTISDNESMNSMDSSLKSYDSREHTQMDNSEEEIDVPRLYEPDTMFNYGEHHHHYYGYIENKRHSNSSESGLLPQPFDIDLDFVPVPSEAVRPTSIDFRLTTSDHAHSDLSSGYITTSCMSHDDGQNVMELLFQQKLKDIRYEF